MALEKRSRDWQLGYSIALAAILAVAAWLRVRGLAVGLPAVYNPDEIAILSRALAFATGDLNPHNFLYPSFFFYLLFGWIGAYFVFARLVGAVPSLGAFQTQFFTDPSSIYLAGRTLGVVCGVLAVLATWWLARRLLGRSAALVAALFLAVAPTAVRDAHYIKHDVPVSLAAVLAVLVVSRIWPSDDGVRLKPASDAALRKETPSVRAQALLAGAACGVALSIHYYAVFLVAPLALAIWWGTDDVAGRERLRTLGLAVFGTCVTFFALSPFVLLEPRTAWQDIVANRQIVVDRSGAGEGALLPSAVAYARMLWREGLGWPVVLLVVWGALVTWRLSPRVTIWLTAFPLLFLVFISNTVPASRYLNPVLPFIAVVAALAVHDLAARAPRGWRPGVAATLALTAAAPGFLQSASVGRFFQQDDTRTQAQRYLEAHAPEGATVLIQPYSVQLVQSRESLVEALTARIGDPSVASTKFALRLALDPWPAPSYRTLYIGEGGLDADKIYLSYQDFENDWGLETLRRFGVHYVVLKRYNVEDSATVPLRQTVSRAGRLVARYSPYRREAERGAGGVAPFLHNTDTPLDPALERPGPIMEIWAIR